MSLSVRLLLVALLLVAGAATAKPLVSFPWYKVPFATEQMDDNSPKSGSRPSPQLIRSVRPTTTVKGRSGDGSLALKIVPIGDWQRQLLRHVLIQEVRKLAKQLRSQIVPRGPRGPMAFMAQPAPPQLNNKLINSGVIDKLILLGKPKYG